MIQDHSYHGASKKTDESTLDKDSSAPLMHHDPSDLGSFIIQRNAPLDVKWIANTNRVLTAKILLF